MYNLGTGKPASVLDLIHAFEKVSGTQVKYILEGRRTGDIVAMYANPSLALNDLGWSAVHDLNRMCKYLFAFRLSVNGSVICLWANLWASAEHHFSPFIQMNEIKLINLILADCLLA